jgi:polysaccharide biosynthesis/export protein
MHFTQRPWRLLVLFALLTATLTGLIPAFAQTNGSSVEQLLQGLSPEQLGSISQMGGLNGTQGAQGVSTQHPTPATEEQQNLMLQQQRDALQEQQRQRGELQRLSPFLEGDDWIVITIDSNPLPTGNAPLSTGQSANGGVGTLAGATPQQQQNLLGNLAPGLSASQGALAQGAALTANGVNGTGTAANPTGAGLAAATSAAMIPPVAQGVTAGGYALLPLPCTGQPNCDPSIPSRPELTDEEKRQRDHLIELVRSQNPYQLSHDGVLSLPGFGQIPLAGLTEQLATLRLGVEPALRDLFIRVTKLPLNKRGATALKPFGYDLFDHPISTFAPTSNVPVPANYVVGPGDELDLQLFGSKNANLRLIVGRDGRVGIPELGPVNVGALTFESAKAEIESLVARRMTGVQANVTMGDTRTIRVFVLGYAKSPGSYTISGLGTITSALFAAGGVQSIGSLRNIELKRHGELVRRLDLYDMLIRGDNTDDAKLLPDDVILIPSVGATVAVDGEVHRPAIYEIRKESSVSDLIELAGGLTPEADTGNLALTRVDPNVGMHRVVLRVDLGAASARTETVRNGDSLRVSRLRPTLDAGVMVEGYVYATGAFAYRAGMRLTDVIRSVDDLRPNADLHYILIRRETAPDRRVTVLSADLAAALQAPGSTADIALQARDRIMVFDLQSSRDRIIRPLLDDLKLQSNVNLPDDVVRIDGRANVPGQYPLEEGMTVRDLIRAGGGLSDAAYVGNAELTRYPVVNGDTRSTIVMQVNLAAVMRGDPNANLRLQPFDTLSIKEIQEWTDQESIVLRGQVRYPGTYSIKPGETLKSVLLRAGGLTAYAFPEGSVFTRKELREREQNQLDMLALRMQNDIAFVALQGTVANQAGAASALTVGQSLLTQLRAAKAVGRMVINLPRLMSAAPGSSYDVVLRDGDQLIVPKFEQSVTVIGEVQTVTSHLYRKNLSRDDYIAMSGGVTQRADKGRIYVVRADGSVVPTTSRWFSGDVQMEPGDTVVVPLNAEHMPPLPLWQAVSQILYNVAIAVLAIHDF